LPECLWRRIRGPGPVTWDARTEQPVLAESEDLLLRLPIERQVDGANQPLGSEV
jgi:hypothetical protein